MLDTQEICGKLLGIGLYNTLVKLLLLILALALKHALLSS